MAPPTMHQRQALATDHAARYAAIQRNADRDVERLNALLAARRAELSGRAVAVECAPTRRDTDRPTQWERIHAALREEFGILWPMYAFAFVALCSVSLTLVGLYFWSQP